VNARTAVLLSRATLSADALALLELGLHHEQQHQELMLTDLKHLLGLNPLHPAFRAGADGSVPDMATMALSWTTFEGGLVELGHDGAGFAFDNEGPRHKRYLEAFELADRPVSNGEYLAFVEGGGYQRPELWLSDGWAALSAQS
jgi:formylglycine-generating enzyme required for sulfatase activity